MKETLEMILLGINVCSVVFFFGFYFSQFKSLVKDVTSIRESVESIDTKVDDWTLKVATMQGRIDRFGTEGPRR